MKKNDYYHEKISIINFKKPYTFRTVPFTESKSTYGIYS